MRQQSQTAPESKNVGLALAALGLTIAYFAVFSAHFGAVHSQYKALELGQGAVGILLSALAVALLGAKQSKRHYAGVCLLVSAMTPTHSNYLINVLALGLGLWIVVRQAMLAD